MPFRDTPRLCRVPATESRQGPHQTGQEGRSAPQSPATFARPPAPRGATMPHFWGDPRVAVNSGRRRRGIPCDSNRMSFRVEGTGRGQQVRQKLGVAPERGGSSPANAPPPGQGLSSAARRVRVLCRASPHVRRLGCEYCRTTPPPSRRRFAAGMGKLRTGFTLAPPCAFTKGVRGVRSYPTRHVTRVSRADSPARLEA